MEGMEDACWPAWVLVGATSAAEHLKPSNAVAPCLARPAWPARWCRFAVLGSTGNHYTVTLADDKHTCQARAGGWGGCQGAASSQPPAHQALVACRAASTGPPSRLTSSSHLVAPPPCLSSAVHGLSVQAAPLQAHLCGAQPAGHPGTASRGEQAMRHD